MNNEELTKWFENDKNNNELLKLYKLKWNIVEKYLILLIKILLFYSSLPYLQIIIKRKREGLNYL